MKELVTHVDNFIVYGDTSYDANMITISNAVVIEHNIHSDKRSITQLPAPGIYRIPYYSVYAVQTLPAASTINDVEASLDKIMSEQSNGAEE